MQFKFDNEKTKQKIALLLDKITTEADPQFLNEYRRLFKKEVPFSRRSWAAAYLLMLHDQGQGGGRGFSPNFRAERGGGEASRSLSRNSVGDRKPDSPRTLLTEEESRRLFISVGRNRHLFPREILGLIITKAQVTREDIGAIRILDSYSFVQVRDTVADTIIEALNGTMFRGRTLSVNYARSRREEGAAPAYGGDDPGADDYPAEEESPLDETTDMDIEEVPEQSSDEGDDDPDKEGV
jgi:RNA recognition motif-containing protein